MAKSYKILKYLFNNQVPVVEIFRIKEEGHILAMLYKRLRDIEKKFFKIFLWDPKCIFRARKSWITIHRLWEGPNTALWFFYWKIVENFLFSAFSDNWIQNASMKNLSLEFFENSKKNFPNFSDFPKVFRTSWKIKKNF